MAGLDQCLEAGARQGGQRASQDPVEPVTGRGLRRLDDVGPCPDRPLGSIFHEGE